MLSDEQIQSYLDDIERKLKYEDYRKKVELTGEWIKSFPSTPGIYIAFEDNYIVYVGETGNIRERMRDLQDSRHHTLRRNLGRINFSKERGFKYASTKNKFPSHIESKVVRFLRENIVISALPLKLGRRELEEMLINKYNPKYNSRQQRKIK